PSHKEYASSLVKQPLFNVATEDRQAVLRSLKMEHPCTPLQTLFLNLSEAFRAERAAGYVLSRHQPEVSLNRLNARVTELVQEYVRSGHSDWQSYLEFNPHHYVRHLVDENEDFEMMLLCWQPGQASHVHNHAESHCWLTCMQGAATEMLYKPAPASVESSIEPKSQEDRDPPGIVGIAYPCPALELVDEHRLNAGQTGYINDSMALHAVGIPADVPAPGSVTLHIYSPPIRRVKLFEPDSNRIVTRKPGFWSVRGVRQ
ncbi:hypothetical protein H632_c3057p0, partial [Helicosporidium sp. ATCC 50920]